MQWRNINRGNYINGSKCTKCSELYFPVKLLCKKCGSIELKNHRFRGNGKIYSFSTIYFPPTGYEKQVPYVVAMIELEEGPKMTAQVIECDKVEVGRDVKSCIRKIYADGKAGIIHYGIKFRPADQT